MAACGEPQYAVPAPEEVMMLDKCLGTAQVQ